MSEPGRIDPEMAAAALKMVMAALSEERYCASWDVDLHDLLWRDMACDPNDEGERVLRALYDAAGGWWVSERPTYDLRFVPRAEWEAMQR